MIHMNNLKKIVGLFTLFVFSVAGIKSSDASTQQPSETLLAQRCSGGVRPINYARVTTKKGTNLLVRNGPNGRIIGKIPSGWAVVPVRRDRTGKWTRIKAANYANAIYDVNDNYGYGNAPEFRTGWVSTAFLKPIGRFCEKPIAMIRMQMQALFGNQSILVNEDWLQKGDRISRAITE
jgi:hypothetical protein